jgi:hypothetical protein
LLGIADRVLYQAENLESLVANFEAAVDEYVEFLEALNREQNGEARPDDRLVDMIVRSIA